MVVSMITIHYLTVYTVIIKETEMLLGKTKKSLNAILSVFTKAKAELEAWEELSASEQADMEQRIKLIKQEREEAQSALKTLNNILGKEKSVN